MNSKLTQNAPKTYPTYTPNVCRFSIVYTQLLHTFRKFSKVFKKNALTPQKRILSAVYRDLFYR